MLICVCDSMDVYVSLYLCMCVSLGVCVCVLGVRGFVTDW